MNSRDARKIWRSILRKKRKREKMSIRCTTKKEVGMQNLGPREGSPETGSTGKVVIFRRDVRRNCLDLGRLGAKFCGESMERDVGYLLDKISWARGYPG